MKYQFGRDGREQKFAFTPYYIYKEANLNIQRNEEKR